MLAEIVLWVVVVVVFSAVILFVAWAATDMGGPDKLGVLW